MSPPASPSNLQPFDQSQHGSYCLPSRLEQSHKKAKNLQHSIIFHICTSSAWATIKNGKYRCPSLESGGFIHCSTHDQILEVANYLFRGQRDLLLLVIDPQKVLPSIRYEDAGNGKFYPHIYGPLNVNAVVAVQEFEPSTDGTFDLQYLSIATYKKGDAW